MFKSIKYPISLLYLFGITVYLLCSLNGIVKQFDDNSGFAAFLIGCTVIGMERSQYE